MNEWAGDQGCLLACLLACCGRTPRVDRSIQEESSSLFFLLYETAGVTDP